MVYAMLLLYLIVLLCWASCVTMCCFLYFLDCQASVTGLPCSFLSALQALGVTYTSGQVHQLGPFLLGFSSVVHSFQEGISTIIVLGP